MHPIGQVCIYVWAVAMLIAPISGIIFLFRLITRKDRKVVKWVFLSSIAVAIGSFVLYGVTSPVVRCKHEFTTISEQLPTCTVDGKKEQYCPLCDFTKRETLEATGHNMVTKSKREPTYEVAGEFIEKCSVCGFEVITQIDTLNKEPEPTERPKSDKEIAQEISERIGNIGTVTLDRQEEILDIKNDYDQLTKKQKKYVKNYNVLQGCLNELNELLELEELQNDPTYTLTQDDLVGIWKEKYPGDTHTAYYYFTENGYIYYIACKYVPKQSDFTSEYRVSTSYEFGNYDKATGLMQGSFYCSPVYDTIDFTVECDENGNMTMVISRNGSTRGTGQGTYTKTSIYVNGNPATESNSGRSKHICEECSREGTHRYESFTGQTEYYCSEHYEELMEMLKSFGLG